MLLLFHGWVMGAVAGCAGVKISAPAAAVAVVVRKGVVERQHGVYVRGLKTVVVV